MPEAFPVAVLWDLDGTIVDTEPLWIDAEYDLARRHGAEWTRDDALKLVGNDLLASGRYIRERMGLTMTAEQVVDELVGVMAERMEGPLVWRPGALELLADLRTHNVPTALVTMSYRAIVEPLLRRIPDGSFDTVVVGDEVSDGKPHPAPYLTAARLLGVDPADCVAIEDSPTGAASAAAAGCRVLAVPHHVAVPASPRTTRRDTLEGLDARRLLTAATA
ncbi:HAD family hydrolase [Solicola gregarius]|uniref:HAD family phosphatase n=1 Tax=Solicola gregarius TaxID=2908642 RepID=A0AA46THN3_9ACTN|nr:HAD family phosphatase [Solicola gregarius]UYM05029.1 HAD family phosphatase [Solicola gregarius]